MNESIHEQQLVLLSQYGDKEALEKLLRKLQAPLFSYIRRMVGAEAAEDVLQDVFIQICRNLGSLREPQFFRAWAYRISTRTCFTFLRRARLWNARHDDAIEIDAVPVNVGLESNIIAREVCDLVDGLSPASKAVLVLHYFQNLTIQEVAAILGISAGTVKSRLAYGLKCLRNAAERKI